MASTRGYARAVAIFSLVAIAMFWATMLVAGALTPGYSQARDATSELGAVGQPYWWLNSFFGIVPVAVATFLAGWMLLARYRPGPLAWIAAMATVIAGAAFLLVGLSRCDVNCAPSDLLSANIHFAGAAIGFNIFLFGPLVHGLRSFRKGRNGFHVAALLIGIVYWCTLLLFTSGAVEQARWLGFGFWQKVTIALVNAWLALICLETLSHPRIVPAR